VKINQTHVTQNLAKMEEDVVIMEKLIPVNVLTDGVEEIVLLKPIKRTHVLQVHAKIKEGVQLKETDMCVNVPEDTVADIVLLNHHHLMTMTNIKLT